MGGKTVKRLKSVTTLRPKLTGSQEGRTNIHDIIGLPPYPELLTAYNQSKIKEVLIVEGGLASYNKVYYNLIMWAVFIRRILYFSQKKLTKKAMTPSIVNTG